jgi:uncharacterized protein
MITSVVISTNLTELYNYLKFTYNNNLDEIILFGSEARKEAKIDSDIDILIVLNQPFNYYKEVKKITQFISDSCLKYNRLISYGFSTSEELKNNESAFYRNIRKEGIKL